MCCDDTSFAVLLGQQSGCLGMQVGLLRTGQVLVDGGPDDRVDKPQRLAGQQDLDVDEAGG